jgi:hypothetical protein
VCATWVLLAFATLPLVSCGGEGDAGGDDPSLATQEEPLYYLTGRLWPQRDIRVCWYTPGYATEKEWVRSTLASKRSWAAAGNVVFTSWSECPNQTATAGIRISLVEANAVTYGLGRQNSGLSDVSLDVRTNTTSNYPACSNNGLNREDCFKAIALHEIGHALSFAHEHNRDDRPGWCTEAEAGSDGDATFGDWDAPSIMNYCSSSIDLSGLDRRGMDAVYGQPYADPPRHMDLNDDRRADLLCFDARNATRWGDFASSTGTFEGTEWTVAQSAQAIFNCVSNGASVRRVFKGDFNGDHRFDLLCQDLVQNLRFIDYASTTGRFEKMDWSANTGWCNHATGRLMVGDFNKDERDDLLCRDTANGTLWIDYASSSGTFEGTDWTTTGVGCTGSGRQYLGDFNGDSRDDLLCHYPFGISHLGPVLAVSLADSSGHFSATTTISSTYCTAPSSELHVGYFNQDARADLLCHDTVSGTKRIRYTSSSGTLGGSGSWNWDGGWCNHNAGRLSLGDFNGDGRDDLMCFDVNDGNRWIDYADTSGKFFTMPGNFTANGWCSHEAGEFH